jgi:hypothetical protein
LLAAALLAASQQPALAGAGAPSGFEPRAATAEELEQAFPAEWRLPRADHSGAPLPGELFTRRVQALARDPLAPADPARPAPALGDFFARVTAAGRLPALDAARAEVARILAEARARVSAADWRLVEPLLDVHDFLSPKWDPDDGDERSGFLIGESWSLPEDCWPRHGGKRRVEQCAVLIAADLECIKLAETNLTAWFDYPANHYLSVLAVRGSYRYQPLADAPLGVARTCLAVDFRSDLPWPLGDYGSRLVMLTELGDDGAPVTYVHGSGKDFYWLAGSDRYAAVHDSGGAFAGTLVVRQMGCDLDGVPDGASDHRGGLRTVLGGVKRQAEALWRARGAAAEPFPAAGAVPLTPLVPGESR